MSPTSQNLSLARKPATADPARIEERYALAMESINYGLCDGNLETNDIYYAPGLRIILGLPPAALQTADDWKNRIHPADWPDFRRRLVEHLNGETPRFLC